MANKENSMPMTDEQLKEFLKDNKISTLIYFISFFNLLPTWSPRNRCDRAPLTSPSGRASCMIPPPSCLHIFGWLLCKIVVRLPPKTTIWFIFLVFCCLIRRPKCASRCRRRCAVALPPPQQPPRCLHHAAAVALCAAAALRADATATDAATAAASTLLPPRVVACCKSKRKQPRPGGTGFWSRARKGKLTLYLELKKNGIAFKPNVVPGRKHKKDYAGPGIVFEMYIAVIMGLWMVLSGVNDIIIWDASNV